jgi:hypothetical protein
MVLLSCADIHSEEKGWKRIERLYHLSGGVNVGIILLVAGKEEGVHVYMQLQSRYEASRRSIGSRDLTEGDSSHPHSTCPSSRCQASTFSRPLSEPTIRSCCNRATSLRPSTRPSSSCPTAPSGHRCLSTRGTSSATCFATSTSWRWRRLRRRGIMRFGSG